MFRGGQFAKNSGYLAVQSLQESILNAWNDTDAVTFELGWGQAKRDAGRLKTVGPSADLADLVALTRLITIAAAASIILDRPVRFRIISGGRRFQPALFVRPNEDRVYDEQRAAFVSALGFEDSIVFDTIGTYWSEAKSRRGYPLVWEN